MGPSLTHAMTFNRIADSLFILLCAAMAVVTLAMYSSLLGIYTVPKAVAVLAAAGIIFPLVVLAS